MVVTRKCIFFFLVVSCVLDLFLNSAMYGRTFHCTEPALFLFVLYYPNQVALWTSLLLGMVFDLVYVTPRLGYTASIYLTSAYMLQFVRNFFFIEFGSYLSFFFVIAGTFFCSMYTALFAYLFELQYQFSIKKIVVQDFFLRSLYNLLYIAAAAIIFFISQFFWRKWRGARSTFQEDE